MPTVSGSTSCHGAATSAKASVTLRLRPLDHALGLLQLARTSARVGVGRRAARAQRPRGLALARRQQADAVGGVGQRAAAAAGSAAR